MTVALAARPWLFIPEVLATVALKSEREAWRATDSLHEETSP